MATRVLEVHVCYINRWQVQLSFRTLVPPSAFCLLTDCVHLEILENKTASSVYYHVHGAVKRSTASRGIKGHFIFHGDPQCWAATALLGSMLHLTDIDNWPQTHSITATARHKPSSPTHQNICTMHTMYIHSCEGNNNNNNNDRLTAFDPGQPG